ncbi:MAG: hypothetical protein L3J98_13280 [Gammaproteobacteria bacterium]|nr:hypothetical protein [Gammaproteobacteria bacterium]MCF6261111.1 hypothetical protein [Gammaproteobacteria bacterium]
MEKLYLVVLTNGALNSQWFLALKEWKFIDRLSFSLLLIFLMAAPKVFFYVADSRTFSCF